MTFVTGAMSPESRRDSIAALADKELDVLVIGGGRHRRRGSPSTP